MESKKVILEVNNLKTYYHTRLGEKIKAVNSVSFNLYEGEILGIAGESGCGKSTLAMSLSGLFLSPLKYESGSVFLDNENIMQKKENELRKKILGKKYSYIPQSALNALNPTLKIKNFVIDLMKEHDPNMTEKEILNLAKERFESLSLPPRVLNLYPLELSGGMKQRVVVAISTIMNPEVVVADEPTSALDVTSQKIVIKLIKELFDKKIVKSIIFITHELPILRHICDRIAVMYAGEFVEVGNMKDVIFDPIHPYSQALMQSILVPEKGIKGKKLPSLPGSPPDLRKIPKGCRFADRCPLAIEDCKKDDVNLTKVGERSVRCIRINHILTQGKKVTPYV
ncbi:ABC transporter ATP-binding protein [Petrotoga olearia]|uniref:Peptide ABC transporter ATPase n=2 Tax=Petrotoga olearia TaxID=156203 RepID=A0A2K1P725_9BACT|nr:ABC transporter ATP-binding protein [Petrotoga olearia]PNR98595.1 peptide ABC transporter ATPase [Petrotoga olearia DSM 13574]RMA69303.1 peptide/nickel transport system ATP-binding protein [Petrotoga olearia]